MNDKRIRIITGHYGSGKTEFAVNYAVKLAQSGKKVVISDLDVVNPYFRSREKTEQLAKYGVKVIGSSVRASAVDIPAISSEVAAPLQNEQYEAVLDVGGDPIGARALGRYVDYFEKGKYDMFFVLNANRKETSTVEGAIHYLKNIEVVARANVTGIINNTHLLKSTTVEDVLKGQKLAKELSERLNIPIRYTSVIEKVAKDLNPDEIEGEIFPIKMYMREEWMS
ncbi:tyrosine-protein kinase family protein [Clostridiisalibacter paucivorans]|uniref:nucleotide-binding protein n=1 Tax=Clostridiisalibacter paucivorans TaxID=408753 RepID=UPI00047B24AD|nr:tyrosine-protein kinase family protein [Clostridiisalibacter paucivorans]